MLAPEYISADKSLSLSGKESQIRIRQFDM